MADTSMNGKTHPFMFNRERVLLVHKRPPSLQLLLSEVLRQRPVREPGKHHAHCSWKRVFRHSEEWCDVFMAEAFPNNGLTE